MFVGLMDHWVPSHDAVSRFWRTPFDTLRPAMDAVCDEMAVNNFTFYTKWYTNGIKSALPFLQNHPRATCPVGTVPALPPQLLRRGFPVPLVLGVGVEEAVGL